MQIPKVFNLVPSFCLIIGGLDDAVRARHFGLDFATSLFMGSTQVARLTYFCFDRPRF